MEFNAAGFRLRRRIALERAIFEKTGLSLEFAGDPIQTQWRTFLENLPLLTGVSFGIYGSLPGGVVCDVYTISSV